MSLADIVSITPANSSEEPQKNTIRNDHAAQLNENDVFKENQDEAGLARLMAEMAAAGDIIGGITVDPNTPRTHPRISPFHGVTMVYSRKCLWQSMLAAVVGRKVATVEVNSPGDYPGESADVMKLITAAPTTVVINSPECAKRLADIPGVAQVVSCIETPLSIADLLKEDSANDKIIEESFDGLYAWLGLSPTDVYICDYMRIAAGIGKPSIYGEITTEDARCMFSGLRMSGLVRDDGTGGAVPRWEIGNIRSATYGARGFDNINNYIVVGQTLEMHRTREFEKNVANSPTISLCDNLTCSLVNCPVSETTVNLASKYPAHAVMFFTLDKDHWHCEMHHGAQFADLLDITKSIVENDILLSRGQSIVFHLSTDKLTKLLNTARYQTVNMATNDECE